MGTPPGSPTKGRISAGFTGPQCRTIAYSSQYTDDNNCEIEVFDNSSDTLPSYVSHVSQTEDITKPQKEIMTIYPLFHFVPGDKAAQSPRKDSRSHPLLTTPGSSYANKIMEYTLQNGVSRLREKDYTSLHRLGLRPTAMRTPGRIRPSSAGLMT